VTRLLGLYASGEFSKELLVKRSTKVELNPHLQSAVLSDSQIAELEAFCAEVRKGLDNATFEDKRRHFDLLDVRAKLGCRE
jgi:hypothetical protein